MEKIIVNATLQIAGIQREFNNLFPFLQLEFLPGPGCKGLVDYSKKLSDLSTLEKPESFEFTEEITVKELMRLFRCHYRISVQILRKSGRSWLGTTYTEEWTLEQQNRQGKELSRDTDR